MLHAPDAWAFTGVSETRPAGQPRGPQPCPLLPGGTWQRYTAEGEVDVAGLRCGEPAT
jgi:hypothetical protein